MNHELIHRIECSVKVALKLSTEKVDDNDLVSYVLLALNNVSNEIYNIAADRKRTETSPTEASPKPRRRGRPPGTGKKKPGPKPKKRGRKPVTPVQE